MTLLNLMNNEKLWLDDLLESFENEDSMNYDNSRRFPVDIYEKDENVFITGELPGVDKESMDINIKDNILTIEASKNIEEKKDNDEKNEEKIKYYSCEVRKGKFKRKFKLSKEIDQENIKADYNNGILKLTLPKKEEIKEVKNIQIN
ncbi:MAG TPA: Hsp20/alpha crystallin family protein [Candidatus Mcinerneyibacterium sp.]|nr:Hsp20/alpha crystallin family protein [Candidatus Mcinerneyibacterium sp.]